MKKAIIYTRTGDDGSTRICGGARVRKDDIRVEAYGTLDEVNAHIGVLIELLGENEDVAMLERVENVLFTIGCSLAGDKSPLAIDGAITELEHRIDLLEAELPPLHSFILPPRGAVAAQCNLCRTVSRRAERRMVAMAAEYEISPSALSYVNRLSDYFFHLSRRHGTLPEKKWEKSCQ